MNGRRAAALLAAAAAAGAATFLASRSCTPLAPAPFAFEPGAKVALELTSRESLTPPGAERSLFLALSGRSADAATVALRIDSARYERRASKDEPAARLDPADVATGAVSAGDREMVRILAALAGGAVTLRFDPREGLVAVEGIDAALDATVHGAADPDGDPDGDTGDAQAGLRALAGDAPTLRGLRAAGLAPLPGRFTSGTTERRVPVFVPGRGTGEAAVVCSTGRDEDGSPVVRGEGGIREGAPFTGDPGPEPPSPIVAAGIVVSAETNLLAGRLLPWRGHSSATLPSRAGWSIRRSVSFVLILP